MYVCVIVSFLHRYKLILCVYIIYIYTNPNTLLPICTAQGGGGSFKIPVGNIWERFVSVNNGWQSERTDGSKSGWRQRSVVFVVIAVARQL